MLIREITYYLQGKLSEDDAIELWVRLAKDNKAWRLLEICLYLRDMLKKRNRIKL